jgi:hypothetical protein
MALSSCKVGITTDGCLDILGIIFYLTTIGSAKADNSSQLATFHISYVVKDFSLWCKRDHAQLALIKAVIDPY